MSRFVTAGDQGEYDPKNDAWAKAEAKIKESQKPKPEQGQQEGGRSLFEVLQANKAAKQEAQEEKMKLKNQFRSLDEDEVEFLDSVTEAERAKEQSLRKETNQRLDAFRKQQEEALKAAAAADDSAKPEGDGDEWTVSRKRKRNRDKGSSKALKVRRSSSSAAAVEAPSASPTIQTAKSSTAKASYKENVEQPSSTSSKPPALGLVAYGSDSDDD